MAPCPQVGEGAPDPHQIARATTPSIRATAGPVIPLKIWRRERDSNPRWSFPHSGFQDRRFQPLTHPSSDQFITASGGSALSARGLTPRLSR